ncbi:hypothetical protein KC19_2G026000 [Ceratodon purpureus]|uniref:Inositol-pentakisphosphate 2-kinase n=2 Tax=Ceratodon purpureus TaxID=3225 RepID=A0A8T0IS50_CERPU|nr:hypothetical protein KC19_2G026000 [Ceratodon purpureus]
MAPTPRPGHHTENSSDGAEDKLEFQDLKVMELHDEDAKGWKYRGEGAANIVLAYHGNRPSFIGRVLRIRKASEHDSGMHIRSRKDSKPILSEDERKLWRECPNMSMATTSAALEHLYASEIMQPLLGKENVDAGLLVFLNTGFLEAVNENVVAKQPEWRRKDAKMDTTGRVALLIADHSSFHNMAGKVRGLPQTITIELKPKWGCLPTAATISEENIVKRHVSRFAMHQHLKFQQGKVKSLSKYSPLDLFSGNVEGIHKALVALFETPQNNVRVFLKGEEIFGGSENIGSTDEEIMTLEEKLAAVSVAPEGERIPGFQRLVASALNESKVLDRLLSVQKQDAYDIEGAILAYNKFVGMTDDADDCTEARSETSPSLDPDIVSTTLALETEGEQKEGDQAWIKSLSWEESRAVVRDFLIAATAKNCCLMVTLRPLHNRHGTAFPLPSASLATCPTTGQQYIFKVSFLNLDTKRLKKMPFYHSLDQQIVNAYKACSKQPAEQLCDVSST